MIVLDLSFTSQKRQEKYWNFWQIRICVGKEEKDRGFVRDLSSVWNFEVVQLFSTFYPFLFVSRREAVYYATKIGP